MERKNLILFLALFLSSLVIIFFGRSGVILFLRQSATTALKPAEIIFSRSEKWLTFWQNAIFEIKQTKKSNERLISENLELNQKLAQMSEIKAENALLREKFNLSQKSIATVAANIIGRDFQNNRSFVIDKGSGDGVNPAMAVISENGALVGRVAESSANTARILTLFDTQSRIAAQTATSGVSGLARGLGSAIILDLIDKNKIPQIGDLIISSGTDGIWPKGYLIGKIAKVDSRDSQIFNTAEIEPIEKPEDYNGVLVITGVK